MIWVTDATYVKDYIIRVVFNDGVVKIVNLKHELDEGIFKPLKHIEYFRNFRISANTIEWDNGADFAPEYLRSLT